MTVSPGAAPASAMAWRSMAGSGFEGASSAVWMVAKIRSQRWRATRWATPRRDFPVAMPSATPVLSGKVGDELGRTREERLVPGRIGAQAPERVPVGGGEARDRPVRADQRRERLGQRQADHGQRAGAARRPDAVRREGFALRFDDQMLAVDEGAVDVEHDELHG